MKKTKNNKTKYSEFAEKYMAEHNKICGENTTSCPIIQEWQKQGDSFRKFSIYENYTPVKTSSNTTNVVDFRYA